jgi:prevent-host-death family protein
MSRLPGHFVYRFYDAEHHLLYVGITSSHVEARWAGHRKASEWWSQAAYVSLVGCRTWAGARVLELRAIRQENPQYNIRDHPQRQPQAARTPWERIRAGRDFHLTLQNRNRQWELRIQAAEPPPLPRKTWRMVEARRDLASAASEVMAGERIVLTRHGKPAVALVPIDDLEWLEQAEPLDRG